MPATAQSASLRVLCDSAFVSTGALLQELRSDVIHK